MSVAHEVVAHVRERRRPVLLARAEAGAPLDRTPASAASVSAHHAELAFALHDGPLQDVAALMGQLRLLEKLVPAAFGSSSPGKQVLDALEDLGAGLTALDYDLRDIAWAARTVHPLHRALADVLNELLDDLREGSAIETELELRGELESLSPAIRSTIVQVAQEA